MILEDLFIFIHNSIVMKEKRKSIPTQEMASRINCSKSTYDKYLSGGLNPKAVRNLMCLFSMMKDEDVLKVIKEWKKDFECEK